MKERTHSVNHTYLVGFVTAWSVSSLGLQLVCLLVHYIKDGLSDLILPAIRHYQREVLIQLLVGLGQLTTHITVQLISLSHIWLFLMPSLLQLLSHTPITRTLNGTNVSETNYTNVKRMRNDQY